MVTTSNCFQNKDFCQWWDDVDAAVDYRGWDDGEMLEILIDLYNENCPVPDAANEALEAYEIGIAEEQMGIPSWA